VPPAAPVSVTPPNLSTGICPTTVIAHFPRQWTRRRSTQQLLRWRPA
jgi:hypothetical protein